MRSHPREAVYAYGGRYAAAIGRCTRTHEDFDGGQCGAHVEGDGYTNHCPVCLWSRHVDVDPGDRAATCGGMMAPLSAGFERDLAVLVHRCIVCGHTRRNRVAAGDDPDRVPDYLGRPVSPGPPSGAPGPAPGCGAG